MYVDASAQGTGAVLMQEDQDKVMHPIYYYSYKLKRHQLNYSTIELEALSLIQALKKFHCYLYQNPHKIIIYTDHNPITFLSRMKNNNQRLLRWALFLQEYDLDIRHVRGKDNIFADALSRAVDPSN